MIIVIGGVSCSGKTVMAQRLLEKYHIPYLSLDHLKMGLIRGTTDCGFTALDSDDLIAQKLWPIVRGIIMTAVENGQNLIVEGCYIPPEELYALSERYAKDIISLYLIMSREYIAENFKSGILAHARDIEARGDEERPLDWFIHAHGQLKSRCQSCGASFFEISENYDTDICKAYEWLDEVL